jgi:radical SAM superfamily enzyme YgiQ (UPF0313 family)
VVVLDANAEDLTEAESIIRCVESDADLIGITAITNTMPIVIRIAQGIKDKSNKTVVVGGPHVTFTAEETLSNWPCIDIVVRGEGEITTAELVRTYTRGGDLADVQGITYRRNGQVQSTPDRSMVKKLDMLPQPARDLFPLKLYKPSCILDSRPVGEQYASIISSRGCVNRCLFCSSSHFWTRFRTRSTDNLIEEINLLIDKYDVNRIDFLDDVFTWDPERLTSICQYLRSLNKPVRWTCYARADRMSDELAKEMKNAGCFAVQFGIESGNQEILDRIRKNVTISQIETAVACAQKNNLKVMGDFMVGLPGDTPETVLETLHFAIRLKLNLAFFSITTPFPGTELHDNFADKSTYSRMEVFEAYSLHGTSQYRNENMNAEKIRELYHKCVRSFYLRPGYGWELTRWLLRNPWDVKNYYLLFKAFLESR